MQSQPLTSYPEYCGNVQYKLTVILFFYHFTSILTKFLKFIYASLLIYNIFVSFVSLSLSRPFIYSFFLVLLLVSRLTLPVLLPFIWFGFFYPVMLTVICQTMAYAAVTQWPRLSLAASNSKGSDIKYIYFIFVLRHSRRDASHRFPSGKSTCIYEMCTAGTLYSWQLHFMYNILVLWPRYYW
jgi:hypothetical protein